MLLNNHKDPSPDDNRYLMKHIEVHVAEHCNLNCKHCCHFSSIAEKEFYDLDKFRQDMDRMSYLLRRRLFDFHLLGGEPLLNPQINEYAKISRQFFPKTRISIITNGILLDKMDKSFWKTLNENRINIVPSLYPIKIKWKSVLKKAEKYNVGIYNYYDCKQKLTLEYLEHHHKNIFYKMTLKESGYTGVDKIQCIKRRKCNNMSDGKLYPCYFMAYIRHLNKKFNTDFKITDKDYLDIYKIEDAGEIKKFLQMHREYPFCKYCSCNYTDVKWENSPKHTIDEWVEQG